MRCLNRSQLRAALVEARQYTRALVDDLDDDQWRVPLLPIVNPFLWEVGHVGWFMEHWCLRWRGADRTPGPSILAHADRWYDSSRVAHDTRWSLDLPSRAATLDYLDAVLAATLDALERADETDAALYFFRLALYHEDMHGEAFAYMRHTLGYPAPANKWAANKWGQTPFFEAAADVDVAGGEFEIGALPPGKGASGFVFDNEKWAHPHTLRPFRIAARPVSNGEYLRFVEDGGYARTDLWSGAGKAWLDATRRGGPRDWRKDERTDGSWLERHYDAWQPLMPQYPVQHVAAFEAEAYCAWAGRRLPTEAEWEAAALATAIVPAGVWEWTASPFVPYPGFSADPYADYSAPWFHTHRVLRGASFATPARIVHPKFRNFYLPGRDDVFVGFRTCAVQSPL
ncbi:MAG TPA: selenoneine synthase SenA [Burkholderiaceae bacterium]|nr:selenoneine synthase SenA [Burkholderiaceae bacterium]